MKKGTLLLTLALLIIAFSSCDKVEDGAYSPKEKISKIYDKSYDGEKELTSSWNWKDKELQSIDYYWGGEIDYSEIYSYNKDGRIESIINHEYDEVIKYEYDGKKLAKAYYYDCGEIEYEYDFVYDGKKISEIGLKLDEDYIYKKDSKKMNFDPLSIILPKSDVAKIEKLAKKACLSKEGGDIRVPIKLEWDGDNISKMSLLLTVEGVTVGIEMEYKYDDKLNPFKNLLTTYPEEALHMECSKNNIIEVKATEFIEYESILETESETVFYTYTYDGKYPETVTAGYGTTYYKYI